MSPFEEVLFRVLLLPIPVIPLVNAEKFECDKILIAIRKGSYTSLH